MKHSTLNILNLSKNEKSVIKGLLLGCSTPLALSRYTSIPRPTVYVTLEYLERRGIVEKKLLNKKPVWSPVDESTLDALLMHSKRDLLAKDVSPDIGAAPKVRIYKTKGTILEAVKTIFKTHKGETMWGPQSKAALKSFNKVFSVDEIKEINSLIKKNKIIIHAILEEGWLSETLPLLGYDWAKSFEGRTTSAREMNSQYMRHSTEIWLFKNSLYILSLEAGYILEIEDIIIVKMIRSLLAYIQDTTVGVDINHLIRKTMSDKGFHNGSPN